MDQIQLQASKLWELIFSEETGETYQKTLNLTGTILKESAQLIWLVICSVFVFGAWFGDASMKAGNGLRGWIDAQSNPSAAAADKKPLAETGKSLLETGRTGAAYLLEQAREQLGLEPAPPAPVKKPSMPKLTKAPEPATPTQPAETSRATSANDSPKPSPTPSASGPSVAKSSPAAASDPTAEISREASDDGWPPQESD
ncbi:MAG: hypothetical protein ACFB16_10355 [Phormidesmis sp.]